MSDHPVIHWALIAFVVGAALGYLVGSGTIPLEALMNPKRLMQMFGG